MAGAQMQNELKKLQHTFGVTDKEIATYRRLFVEYDADRNGSVTRSEILNILDFLSQKISKDKFQDLFKNVKLNKAKQVEEIDYLKVMFSPHASLDECSISPVPVAPSPILPLDS